ncbi:hypothetical protein DFJ74DRAFT_707787 [Hyaloraphidium curvatum]|nr:hypothetical protein DFJ74DRAFT_707787 [Hyaloraphidium curvatum]
MDTKSPPFDRHLLARVDDLEARVAVLSAESERRARFRAAVKAAVLALLLALVALPILAQVCSNVGSAVGLLDPFGDTSLLDNISIEDDAFSAYLRGGKHPPEPVCPPAARHSHRVSEPEPPSQPEVPFERVEKGSGYEIRRYARVPIVSVNLPGAGGSISMPPMLALRILVGYLGGENNSTDGKCRKVPAIRPMYTAGESGNVTVAVALPPDLAEIPAPLDPRIIVGALDGLRAVPSVAGRRPDEGDVAKASKKLHRAVPEKWFVGAGPTMLAAFVPPWVPAKHPRNEVMLPVYNVLYRRG